MILRVHIFTVKKISDNKNSTNKTDRHYTTEILLKVALNTITLTLTPGNKIIIFRPNSTKTRRDIRHALDQQA